VAPAAPPRGQGGAHDLLVRGGPRAPRDLLAEGEQGCLVLHTETVEEGAARAAQGGQPRAGNAAAGVEYERRLHRTRLRGDELRRLQHAAVLQLEVRGVEAGNASIALRDEDVDVDVFDGGGEHRRRRGRA
jgi:hypothetical protein